jgi:hypothetical protein
MVSWHGCCLPFLPPSKANTRAFCCLEGKAIPGTWSDPKYHVRARERLVISSL